MSEPSDRKRIFLPLPPEEREIWRRDAVRVIVRADDHILLFEDSDPAYDHLRWWVTPGGGIDPGETHLEAAVRELWEETGLRADGGQLVGPLSTRLAVHGFSDQIVEQAETFYLIDVTRFVVDIAGHTVEEQLTLQSHRWWPLCELAETDAWIWPHYLPDLVELAAQPPSRPIDYGRETDESTLAV